MYWCLNLLTGIIIVIMVLYKVPPLLLILPGMALGWIGMKADRKV